jgi:hypothetical protein
VDDAGVSVPLVDVSKTSGVADAAVSSSRN